MWWIVNLSTGEQMFGFEEENDAEYYLQRDYPKGEYGLSYEMKGN